MIINKLGYTYNVKEDKYAGFWNLLNNNGWESGLFHILKNNLTKDSIYIDIGSWIGPTVLFASQLSNNCYAIEPDEVAFDTMKENISLNKVNISINNMAIMDYDGEVSLGTCGEKGDSMSSVLFDKKSNKVKCNTLNTFITHHKLEKVDFIKIDTEGAESIILPNIKELIILLGYPCINLSIHQKLFKQRNEDVENVLSFCSLYDISSEQIMSIKNNDFFDIFLTK